MTVKWIVGFEDTRALANSPRMEKGELCKSVRSP